MMKLTRKEEINFLISNLKADARNFAESHYPELKEFFAERISQNQYRLVQLGYTWEQVEEMEIEEYNVL